APGIVATCFHLGAVGSEFGQDEPGPMRVAMRLARPFLRTPARGADTGIWLATAPEAASLSGPDVVDRPGPTPPGQGADDTLAAELWRISERLVGLAPRARGGTFPAGAVDRCSFAAAARRSRGRGEPEACRRGRSQAARRNAPPRRWNRGRAPRRG